MLIMREQVIREYGFIDDLIIVCFIVKGMSIFLKFDVIKRIEVVLFEIVIKYFIKFIVEGKIDVIEMFKIIVFVYSFVDWDLLYWLWVNCEISIVDFMKQLIMLRYIIFEGFKYFVKGIDVSWVRVKFFQNVDVRNVVLLLDNFGLFVMLNVKMQFLQVFFMFMQSKRKVENRDRIIILYIILFWLVLEVFLF